MSFLAIDPGISTGWALVDASGTLIACGRGQDFPPCKAAVIELPQVYRPGVSRAKPEDIITLAVRVGQYKERLESRGVRVSLVKPASWKGQLKKPVHHPRILRGLNSSERVLVFKVLEELTEKQAEDVWDAIGLSKEALHGGRFVC